jgi:beta-lactamase regulating signal transducer with metallopeptidase domain
VWLSLAALAALGALATRVVREVRSLRRQFTEVIQAHAELAGRGERELVVLNDVTPRAHAVSRTITRRGRVIVTTAMLDLLDDEERAAVVAHERSHLRHAHGAFLAIGDLAVALIPILASTRRDVRFALERWADEDAADATSRTVTASALAKAALATLQTANAHAATFAAMHLHAHAVTDRVAALLDDEPPRRARLAWALIGTAVLAAAALLWATHDTERFFEAVRRM